MVIECPSCHLGQGHSVPYAALGRDRLPWCKRSTGPVPYMPPFRHSALPGPHDYRSAGIAPALDHVGAGVLEVCVAYTGRIPWVGSPLGRNATLDHRSLWFLPPSGLPEGPTLSTGGNIPRIRRRAIAGERRVSARRIIRGGPAARAGSPATVPSHKGRCSPIFFVSFSVPFFSPFTVVHDSATSGSRPLPLIRI